jgi:hypothetical protein
MLARARLTLELIWDSPPREPSLSPEPERHRKKEIGKCVLKHHVRLILAKVRFDVQLYGEAFDASPGGGQYRER